eukprot:6755788-Prymnesium_polylepis.1
MGRAEQVQHSHNRTRFEGKLTCSVIIDAKHCSNARRMLSMVLGRLEARRRAASRRRSRRTNPLGLLTCRRRRHARAHMPQCAAPPTNRRRPERARREIRQKVALRE